MRSGLLECKFSFCVFMDVNADMAYEQTKIMRPISSHLDQTCLVIMFITWYKEGLILWEKDAIISGNQVSCCLKSQCRILFILPTGRGSHVM